MHDLLKAAKWQLSPENQENRLGAMASRRPDDATPEPRRCEPFDTQKPSET